MTQLTRRTKLRLNRFHLIKTKAFEIITASCDKENFILHLAVIDHKWKKNGNWQRHDDLINTNKAITGTSTQKIYIGLQ